METFIHKYLTRHYELSTSIEATKKLTLMVTYGIYHKSEGDDKKEEIYNTKLLKELGVIFTIDEVQAKAYVNNWAKKINKKASLKAYWEKLSMLIPAAMRIAAQTIGMDLVSVQPMGAPIGQLFHFDHPSTVELPAGAPNRRDEIYQEIVESQVPAWKLEKIMKLMENQTAFVSSRGIKKEE